MKRGMEPFLVLNRTISSKSAHSKNAGLFQTKVGSNMDKSKLWFKIFNCIFKPNDWVCPYLTQSWVKTTQHFLKRILFNA